MKPSVPKQAFLVILFLYSFLQSCTKSNNCPASQTVSINHNGAVVVGWPLSMEADVQSADYIYKWSGPNGWKKQYDGNASDAYLQVHENMTAADAGEYKLQLINTDGCLAYEGSTMVDVVSSPQCNIAANTSTSSVAGKGNFNFIYRSFSESNGHYVMSGAETVLGDYMGIAFPSDVIPQPGIFKTGEYFGIESGKVGLFIAVGGYTYTANADQPVFLTRINNKFEINFCSIQFDNPSTPGIPIIISAKIVEP